MRTISSNLLTAQRSQNPHGYVRVVVTEPVSPYTVYTFDNVGYSGALKRVMQVGDYEEVYGGAATIRLSNYDQYFSPKGLEGWQVELHYGFRVSTNPDVYEWAQVRDLFVWSQKDDASGRGAYTELNCLDMWWQIAANETLQSGEQLVGELTDSNLFQMGETITGSPSGATGVLVGVGFDKILVTAVSGTFATDTSASGAGGGSVAIDSVNSIVAASGASANKTTTILNIIKAILPASVTDAVVDEDDPNNTITTYQPLLVTQANESARSIIVQLLQMTKCGSRLENDGKLHILYLDNADVADETYSNATHKIYVQIRERAVIMPNSVLFVDKLPDALGNAPNYSGTAKHQDSVDLIGEFPTTQVNPSIIANGDVAGGAQRFAEAWIHQRVAEAFQGEFDAPMNIRQELYDMVQVEDARSGITCKGRVGRIDRTFTQGRFRIKGRLGGVKSDYSGIPGWDELPSEMQDTAWHIDIPSIPKIDWASIPWETVLPKAVQGFDLDIQFSATDWDTVAWQKVGGGNPVITFYDLTQRTITAGNTGDLSTDDIYYIWFDASDSDPPTNLVLHVGTQSQYLSAFNETVGLVCTCQRSQSGTSIDAWFIPSKGKQPLITPDVIDMTGTKSYDFGGGMYFQALLNNQIDAGKIYLSANTAYASETYNIAGKEYAIKKQGSAPTGSYDYLWFDTTRYTMYRWNGASWSAMVGEWYNKTGVLIDSTKGIRCYGSGMAFATYNNETNARAGGTTGRQCYMGTNGQILAGGGQIQLDSTALYIKNTVDTNAKLLFHNSSDVLKAYVQLSASYEDLLIYAYNDLLLQGAVNLTIGATSGDIHVIAGDDIYLDGGTIYSEATIWELGDQTVTFNNGTNGLVINCGTVDLNSTGTLSLQTSNGDAWLTGSNGDVHLSATYDLYIPDHTSGHEGGSPSEGAMYWDTTNHRLRAYANGSWVTIGP